MGNNRDFHLFITGRFLATISSHMQLVAVGWQVYELTHRPLDLGLVGLAQFLPVIGFSIFAGHVADRFDRRKIISICLLTMVLCSAFFFLESRAEPDTLTIYALLFTYGTAEAFLKPSANAILPQLVSTGRLPKAIALNTSTWQAAAIVGPSLGGFLYGWAGKASAVYGWCAVLVLAALAAVLWIRASSGELDRKPMSRDTLLAGLRYVRGQKVLLGAVSLDLFAVLLGGSVALLPAYASDILHVGPSGLGLLRSAPGVGAVLMGALLALRPIERKSGMKMFLCVGGFGIFTVLFGLSSNFMLSLFCLFMMGALDLVSIITRHSLIQMRTPPEMRGRVSAVSQVFIGASNELGEFESGVAAAWMGLVPSVVLGGIGTCVITVAWAFLFPALRRLDRIYMLTDET